MGRVNWIDARDMYIRDTRNSYSYIAQVYGVSKSTIQAKATKENWPELRRRGVKQAVSVHASKQELVAQEMNDRHLDLYKGIEAVAANLLFDYSQLSRDNKLKDVTTLGTLARVLKLAITEQRKILGLPDGNPDDWEDLKKLPEISVDDAVEAIDKLIARKKRLEKLRNQQKAGLL